jgi:hypothetical protein
MEHDGGAQNLKNGRNRGPKLLISKDKKVLRHVFYYLSGASIDLVYLSLGWVRVSVRTGGAV